MNPAICACRGDRPYLFVSYAHANWPMVHDELVRLHVLGCRFWYDEGIDPAKIWRSVLYERLEKAEAVLLFLSPNANASEWIGREIGVARDGILRKPVIPVYLAETPLSGELRLLLEGVQAIHKFKLDDEDYHRRIERALPFGVRIPPPDALALNDYGLHYLEQNQLEKAHGYFSRAINLDRSLAIAYYNRGKCRYGLRFYEDCLVDFRQAAALDPELPVPTALMGFRFRIVRWVDKYPGHWLRAVTDKIRSGGKTGPGVGGNYWRGRNRDVSL